MKTLTGFSTLKVFVALMAMGLFISCGSKTNQTSSGGQTSSGPVPLNVPIGPGGIPAPIAPNGPIIPPVGGFPAPIGVEGSVGQLLSSSGCPAYLQPSTFYKQAQYPGSNSDFVGMYQMSFNAGAVTGNPYVGISDIYKDVIIVRKHGSPTQIVAYSVTIYMCSYGNVITPDRRVDGLYVNYLYLGNSQNVAVNEVTKMSIYMGLAASNNFPQSPWFLNTFFPVDMGYSYYGNYYFSN